MFDLKTYLNEKRILIDRFLSNALVKPDYDQASIITDAMEYSLMAGGKRLRPILSIASSEAVCGSAGDDVTRIGCALEMIHTYSLIHDDLPAMDNDDLRRGKPTCHIKYDDATAVLAGDALLTEAFQILSDPDIIPESNAMKWIRVINRISYSAGYKGMIEGQMQDINAEGKDLSLAELEEMHYLKTGALIEGSVITGAIMAGASENELDCLKTYAKRIGLAFQVADDILNVEGDPELMGKAVGSDADRDKATYPAILGLNESREFAEKLISEALDAIETFGEKSAPLKAIAKYIIQRKR